VSTGSTRAASADGDSTITRPVPGELVLEAVGIRKEFPGHVALDDVDLEVARGELHAIIGQNGAGKSTLVKILTGVYRADAGELRVDGAPVIVNGPMAAGGLGIEIVHQDHPMVPGLDVTQNAFLGRELRSHGLLDSHAMAKQMTEALRTIEAGFPANVLANELSVAERMQATIAAALIRRPRILILDEPTASLSVAESTVLFDVIRSVRATGVTVIYISHRLGEIVDLATRVTVLRDGRNVGTLTMAESTREEMIRMMVGRDLSRLYPTSDAQVGEPLLVLRDWQVGDMVRGVDLDVRRGEVVGVAGLVGSGTTELAMSLFGALQPSSGSALLDGRDIGGHNPRRNMDRGAAMVPEDRRSEALFETLSVRENIALSSLSSWSRLSWVQRKHEQREVESLLERLAVASTGPEQRVGELSGGNQQKVVIGRWLARGADLYIFAEPTVGVDVGSKVEIYQQMVDIASRGAAVVMVSSDFDELLQMCDRVVVVVNGRITRDVPRGEADLEELTYWASGGGEPQEAGAAAAALVGRRSDRMRWVRSPRGLTITAMVLILLVIGVMAPRFFAPDNLFDVLKQGSVVSVIAVALTAALAVGGFDLSVGATGQLVTNIVAGSVIGGASTPTAIGTGIVVGAVVGAINGIVIVLLGVPSFVATLGMLFLLLGVTLQVNGGLTHTLSVTGNEGFLMLGQGYMGPVPVILVIVAAVALLLGSVLKRTALGMRLYAVGGNPRAAALRGVSARRMIFLSFLLSGAVAGFAGVLQASYSSGSTAADASLNLLVAALSAAFLGSTISKSQQFDVLGSAIAAMFIAAVANGLILNGLSDLVLPGVQGAILVGAVLVAVVRERRLGQVTVF